MAELRPPVSEIDSITEGADVEVEVAADFLKRQSAEQAGPDSMKRAKTVATMLTTKFIKKAADKFIEVNDVQYTQLQLRRIASAVGVIDLTDFEKEKRSLKGALKESDAKCDKLKTKIESLKKDIKAIKSRQLTDTKIDADMKSLFSTSLSAPADEYINKQPVGNTTHKIKNRLVKSILRSIEEAIAKNISSRDPTELICQKRAHTARCALQDCFNILVANDHVDPSKIGKRQKRFKPEVQL